MNIQRTIILITAIAGMIAAFLPWITITSLTGVTSASISLNGFRGFGIIGFLALAGVVLVLFFAGNKTVPPDSTVKLIIISLGMIALLATLISLSNLVGDEHGNKIKIGAWMMIAATAGIVVQAWTFKSSSE